MGKSWKQNARNDKWRQQKQQKQNKGQKRPQYREKYGIENYQPDDQRDW